MTTKKPAEIVSDIVDLLEPFGSEDRQKIVRAALVLIGETVAPNVAADPQSSSDLADQQVEGLNQKAKTWMKHHNLSMDQLNQVFHLSNGVADVIASEIPGANKREKTRNAYIITGISNLLSSGEPTFSDQSARELCVSSGCYDSANHATIMKSKGNELAGTKDKGWTLTAPGLKHGAELVKSLAK